jgi:sortase (surface protein transpeptidase)
VTRALLAGAAALCLLAGCGGTGGTDQQPTEAPPASAPASAPELTPVSQPDPQQLTIPALDAESDLIPLGLTASREHEVPALSQPQQAGWFEPGPEPGEVGAAVILGHVNGNGQAGIFAQLDELNSGDEIHVDDRTFVVYEVQQAPKDDFPTDRVYGKTDRPELRLITCGGTFDEASGNYRSNVIVFAEEA